jgi:membrane protein implicated in regulation of membrane protease activity
MEPWMIWIAIGVICMIIEIFTPGFLFLSFGLGAIVTGLVTLAHPPVWAQILIYIVITFILFLNLRKISKKLMSQETTTNVNALVGKKGIVTDKIPDSGRGFVKIGGEQWSAVSHGCHSFDYYRFIRLILYCQRCGYCQTGRSYYARKTREIQPHSGFRAAYYLAHYR